MSGVEDPGLGEQGLRGNVEGVGDRPKHANDGWWSPRSIWLR
jgi:hypothetical protein